MNKENRKTYLITLIVLAAFVLLLIGGAFAYFLATVTNNTTPVSVTSTQVANLTEIFNLCSLSNYGICANTYPWVYNTSYWSGSALNSYNVRFVYSDGYLYLGSNGLDNKFVVRPVIQILASAL